MTGAQLGGLSSISRCVFALTGAGGTRNQRTERTASALGLPRRRVYALKASNLSTAVLQKNRCAPSTPLIAQRRHHVRVSGDARPHLDPDAKFAPESLIVRWFLSPSAHRLSPACSGPDPISARHAAGSGHRRTKVVPTHCSALRVIASLRPLCSPGSCSPRYGCRHGMGTDDALHGSPPACCLCAVKYLSASQELFGGRPLAIILAWPSLSVRATIDLRRGDIVRAADGTGDLCFVHRVDRVGKRVHVMTLSGNSPPTERRRDSLTFVRSARCPDSASADWASVAICFRVSLRGGALSPATCHRPSSSQAEQLTVDTLGVLVANRSKSRRRVGTRIRMPSIHSRLPARG